MEGKEMISVFIDIIIVVDVEWMLTKKGIKRNEWMKENNNKKRKEMKENKNKK